MFVRQLAVCAPPDMGLCTSLDSCGGWYWSHACTSLRPLAGQGADHAQLASARERPEAPLRRYRTHLHQEACADHSGTTQDCCSLLSSMEQIQSVVSVGCVSCRQHMMLVACRGGATPPTDLQALGRQLATPAYTARVSTQPVSPRPCKEQCWARCQSPKRLCSMLVLHVCACRTGRLCANRTRHCRTRTRPTSS